jgi:hypothetical protein
MPELTYEKPVVRLTGQNGNVFVILGLISKAMKKAGATKDEVDEFFSEATSGDYNHSIRTAMHYVDVE